MMTLRGLDVRMRRLLVFKNHMGPTFRNQDMGPSLCHTKCPPLEIIVQDVL